MFETLGLSHFFLTPLIQSISASLLLYGSRNQTNFSVPNQKLDSKWKTMEKAELDMNVYELVSWNHEILCWACLLTPGKFSVQEPTFSHAVCYLGKRNSKAWLALGSVWSLTNEKDWWPPAFFFKFEINLWKPKIRTHEVERCCFFPKGLLLYKKICRKLPEKNPLQIVLNGP